MLGSLFTHYIVIRICHWADFMLFILPLANVCTWICLCVCFLQSQKISAFDLLALGFPFWICDIVCKYAENYRMWSAQHGIVWHGMYIVQYTNHTNYIMSMLFDKFVNNNQLHGIVHNLNIFELLNASHCDARPTVMYCTTIPAKCYFILFSMIGISDTW